MSNDATEGEGSAPDLSGLVDALAQATHLGMGILGQVAGENDLSMTQLRVLAILRSRRLRMSDLAGYLGLEKSTLSGLVQRAEQRGLLQRAPSRDDARSVEVFLGPAAEELVQPLGDQVAAGFAPAIARLDPGERSELRRLLEKLLGDRGA